MLLLDWSIVSSGLLQSGSNLRARKGFIHTCWWLVRLQSLLHKQTSKQRRVSVTKLAFPQWLCLIRHVQVSYSFISNDSIFRELQQRWWPTGATSDGSLAPHLLYSRNVAGSYMHARKVQCVDLRAATIVFLNRLCEWIVRSVWRRWKTAWCGAHLHITEAVCVVHCSYQVVLAISDNNDDEIYTKGKEQHTQIMTIAFCRHAKAVVGGFHQAGWCFRLLFSHSLLVVS